MKRRLTPAERRKYTAAYAVAFTCALVSRGDSVTYLLGVVAGASMNYAEAMFGRARTRRFFRNTHGSLLTIMGSNSRLAEQMNLDPSFVEVSPKDVR